MTHDTEVTIKEAMDRHAENLIACHGELRAALPTPNPRLAVARVRPSRWRHIGLAAASAGSVLAVTLVVFMVGGHHRSASDKLAAASSATASSSVAPGALPTSVADCPGVAITIRAGLTETAMSLTANNHVTAHVGDLINFTATGSCSSFIQYIGRPTEPLVLTGVGPTTYTATTSGTAQISAQICGCVGEHYQGEWLPPALVLSAVTITVS